MVIKRTYALAAFAVILFVVLLPFMKADEVSQQTASQADKQSNTESTQQPVLKKSAADKIAIGAYSEYTKAGHPKLYEQVGDAGLEKIFKHDMHAAYLVAAREDCDRVEYSAYSQSASNYPDKIISFVDCQNGSRFYVSGETVEKRQ